MRLSPTTEAPASTASTGVLTRDPTSFNIFYNRFLWAMVQVLVSFSGYVPLSIHIVILVANSTFLMALFFRILKPKPVPTHLYVVVFRRFHPKLQQSVSSVARPACSLAQRHLRPEIHKGVAWRYSRRIFVNVLVRVEELGNFTTNVGISEG